MKNKIIVGLWILIILIGIVMLVSTGFKLSDNYANSIKLKINFNEAFEISDVEKIADEVFGNEKHTTDYSDVFKRGIFITVKEVSDEQFKSLESKLIEKYERFEEGSDIALKLNIPSIKVFDLVKEYIIPIIITTVIVLIVLMIAFRKLGILKALIIPFLQIVGICALYVSIILICRIPVSEYTIAIGVFVYVASLIIATLYTKQKNS